MGGKSWKAGRLLPGKFGYMEGNLPIFVHENAELRKLDRRKKHFFTSLGYNLYKGLHATSFQTGKLVCALPTPQVLRWLHPFNFYSMTNKNSAYLCLVCERNEGNLHHPNW